MEYVNTNGYIISEVQYGINEKALLKNTNRWHKIYYVDTYRADASPYIKINNRRYYLSEFLQAHF